MPPVVWRAEARRDFLAIVTYIGERNPSAANRLADTIEHAVERLPAHPYVHRPGRVSGTREAVISPNYIVVYQVADTIDILSVLHARQQYP